MLFYCFIINSLGAISLLEDLVRDMLTYLELINLLRLIDFLHIY